MALRVKRNQWCGLSRQPDFVTWLKGVAPDLQTQLLQVKRKRSCRSNTEFMMQAYNLLYKRGKGGELETFIYKRFPYVVDKTLDDLAVGVKQIQQPKEKKKRIITNSQPLENLEDINKHKVFGNYKPDILTFPQKRILVHSDQQQLLAMVKNFISNKVGTDYIIVDDRAYIEYFMSMYASEVDKVPYKTREIYKFRQKHAPTSNTDS